MSAELAEKGAPEARLELDARRTLEGLGVVVEEGADPRQVLEEVWWHAIR